MHQDEREEAEEYSETFVLSVQIQCLFIRCDVDWSIGF